MQRPLVVKMTQGAEWVGRGGVQGGRSAADRGKGRREGLLSQRARIYGGIGKRALGVETTASSFLFVYKKQGWKNKGVRMTRRRHSNTRTKKKDKMAARPWLRGCV